MDVYTVEVDADTLSTRKEVDVGSIQLGTPAKALQVGKLRGSEVVSPLARGVAEIYRTANAAALTNSQRGSMVLARRLRSQAESAEDDELVVPFIQYNDTAHLTPENAAEIAKLQTNCGDIVTVPLMTPLVDAADDGDDRTTDHVSAIIENTREFLNAVDELKISKPVMGVIPPISEDCTQALTELYFERGLRAYCVDFNRRSPMAQFQIDHVVSPLMQMLTTYNIRGNSLLYAVNPRYSRPSVDNRRTPDGMYSYTLGFDIVGDNHISPNWPKEVFEEIAKEAEGNEIELRLFDAESVSIVEVPVSNLNSFLPADAEIPVKRIQNRIAQDPDEQYRFRNLINAELISLYLEAEGGVDPREIFVGLSTGNYTQDSDLQRIEDLTDTVVDSG